LNFKGHKMKQTPLTSMEDRWVHSTKEAFDALVEMGYEPYTDKYLGYKELGVVLDGIIFQGGPMYLTSKQAYYHNGNFYDQPYEEFTITEEKVPFPELEDIEWIMVKSSDINVFKTTFLNESLKEMINGFMLVDKEYEGSTISSLNYDDLKVLISIGVDVEYKLKEKINRKLHENRPLALAIGRGLLEGIIISDSIFFNLGAVKINNVGKLVFHNGDYWDDYFTLPDDYIIPEQVLQWMKEYDHTS